MAFNNRDWNSIRIQNRGHEALDWEGVVASGFKSLSPSKGYYVRQWVHSFDWIAAQSRSWCELENQGKDYTFKKGVGKDCHGRNGKSWIVAVSLQSPQDDQWCRIQFQCKSTHRQKDSVDGNHLSISKPWWACSALHQLQLSDSHFHSVFGSRRTGLLPKQRPKLAKSKKRDLRKKVHFWDCNSGVQPTQVCKHRIFV